MCCWLPYASSQFFRYFFLFVHAIEWIFFSSFNCRSVRCLGNNKLYFNRYVFHEIIVRPWVRRYKESFNRISFPQDKFLRSQMQESSSDCPRGLDRKSDSSFSFFSLHFLRFDKDRAGYTPNKIVRDVKKTPQGRRFKSRLEKNLFCNILRTFLLFSDSKSITQFRLTKVFPSIPILQDYRCSKRCVWVPIIQ